MGWVDWLIDKGLLSSEWETSSLPTPRALRLLLSYLTYEQCVELNKSGRLIVIGCESGLRYTFPEPHGRHQWISVSRAFGKPSMAQLCCAQLQIPWPDLTLSLLLRIQTCEYDWLVSSFKKPGYSHANLVIAYIDQQRAAMRAPLRASGRAIAKCLHMRAVRQSQAFGPPKSAFPLNLYNDTAGTVSSSTNYKYLYFAKQEEPDDDVVEEEEEDDDDFDDDDDDEPEEVE